MARKKKVGKTRLDRYYHLAKEQGYRARSAFKLIQLAQKNNIFRSCRTLVDLCAAPGGWLQVAQKNLPVASTIIGVDLVPIKPIKGVTTIQADITTSRCRSLVLKELAKSSCDVVLHDGAPNVGSGWALDAFKQNELVLKATQLASQILRPGGIFVTKVFRSTDYVSLLWAFQQLFRKVTSTKPSSSRDESAEIFVVCEDFKNTLKIDPMFFDAKHVFMNTEREAVETNPATNKLDGAPRGLKQLLAARDKVNRQGFECTRDVHDVRQVSCFFDPQLQCPTEFLVAAHVLEFDNTPIVQRVLEHPLTTQEIKDYCADLRVLGKGALTQLLRWRLRILRQWQRELKEREGFAADQRCNVDVEMPFAEQEAQLERELVALQEKQKKEALRTSRKQRERAKHMQLQKEIALAAFDRFENDPDLFHDPAKASSILDAEDKYLREAGFFDPDKMKWIKDPEHIVQQEIEQAHSLEKIHQKMLSCAYTGSHSPTESCTESGNEIDGYIIEDEGDLNYLTIQERARISQLAVEAELAYDRQKETRGDQAKVQEMKRAKQTRTQKACADWAVEIQAFAQKLKENNERILEKRCQEDDSEFEMNSPTDDETKDRKFVNDQFRMQEPRSCTRPQCNLATLDCASVASRHHGRLLPNQAESSTEGAGCRPDKHEPSTVSIGKMNKSGSLRRCNARLSSLTSAACAPYLTVERFFDTALFKNVGFDYNALLTADQQVAQSTSKDVDDELSTCESIDAEGSIGLKVAASSPGNKKIRLVTERHGGDQSAAAADNYNVDQADFGPLYSDTELPLLPLPDKKRRQLRRKKNALRKAARETRRTCKVDSLLRAM